MPAFAGPLERLPLLLIQRCGAGEVEPTERGAGSMTAPLSNAAAQDAGGESGLSGVVTEWDTASMLLSAEVDEAIREAGTERAPDSKTLRRLGVLRGSGLLDAPAEERFDRLTRLAQRLLHAPAAVIALADAEREFYLSAQGLPEKLASLRQLPLARSFCGHVVQTGQTLAVTGEEMPAIQPPALDGFGDLAWLAVPLALADECVIGALCAIDRGPRCWTAEEEQALADLAGAVAAELASGLQGRELREARAALRESEKATRGLIEALGVAVYTTDEAGRLTFYNDAAVSLWGWRPPLADTRWCGSWRLYRPDGTPLPHEQCPMAKTVRENQPFSGGEVVAERPDGTRVPFIAYPAPLRDDSGELVGAVNVLVDITAREHVEAALKESEARLHLALEAGRLASWELDVATGRVARGPSHDRIFGYEIPRAEWSYDTFLAHVIPEDRDRVHCMYAALTESAAGEFFECRIRRARDGETRWIEVHGQPQRGPDGRVIRHLGVIRDITERKRTWAALRDKEVRLRELQSELLHVSRLSAAGEMASALAHELNQPLTAIGSAVRAVQRMLPPASASAAVREAIDLAAEQALRAGHIVQHLRDFVTRDGEDDKRIESLSKLAEEAGALALVDAREHGVHVAFDFDQQLPPVLVDRIQIQQVLLNLMRNALEAMGADPRGEAAPRRELTVTARASGAEMVEVAVADTGPGLAPDIAGRLFQAFFTTKPGGMGMGLSICRSIVTSHGGRLWTAPKPGGGTVFRFTLPAAADGLLH